MQAAVDSDLVLCTSPALLTELRTVPAREHLASRLKRQHSTVDLALTLYSSLAVSVFPTEAPRVVPADARR